MAQPNICQPGYNYFQDLAAGPGVDASWTIEQLSGTDGVIQTSSRYQHKASNPTSDDHRSIYQTFSGAPTVMQADIGLDYSFAHIYEGSNSSGYFPGIIMLPGGFTQAQMVGLWYYSNSSPLFSPRVIKAVLQVLSNTGTTLYTSIVYTHTLAGPETDHYSATLKVVNVGGGDVAVYLDGALQFTSTTHDVAMTVDQSIQIGRQYDLSSGFLCNIEGWINNISYAGASSLPSVCMYPPDPPTLTFPTNTATGVSLTPTLTWNAGALATSYHFQIATDAGFSSLVYDVSGITDLFYAVSLSGLTQYYWRVSSHNSLGDSAYSSVFSFTTLNPAPGAPTPTAPTNGGVVDMTSPVTLSWTGPGSDYTQYQISKLADFSVIYADHNINNPGTDSLPYDLSAEPAGTTFYWRARAYDGSLFSSWTSTWTFIIDALPDIPTLANPHVGSVNVSSLAAVLSWNDANLADSYRLQVSKVNTFATTVYDVTGITDLFKVVSLDDLTLYYWRVSAHNSIGDSDWSDIWGFYTDEAHSLFDFITISVDGWNELVISIAGEFISGSLGIVGCVVNGNNSAIGKYVDLSTGENVAGNAISAPGVYRINVAGLREISFSKSNDYAGTLTAQYNLSKLFNRQKA